jgi:hypothetical protein
MEPTFHIDHLDVEHLLNEWRWLCPEPVKLVARTAFGDLFLSSEDGNVMWLDVAEGRLTKVARSVSQFRELLRDDKNRDAWLAEGDAKGFAMRGLEPNENQCIGFATPLVFAEASHPDSAYVANIYDYIGFLGDLHKQINELPDGAKVRLQVSSPPKNDD